MGFKEGKELGQTLKIIENLVYEEKLNNDKKEIINYIKSNILNVDW